MPTAALSIFGIRHHGPGSARSLLRALQELKPDRVLIEGPSDGGDALNLVLDPQMEPPISLLGYVPERPRSATSYPFAVFSPEWQAMKHCLKQKIPVQFMDLPFAVNLAMQEEAEERERREAEANPGAEAETVREAIPAHASPRLDPLSWLAEAAGYSDGERWWEHMVEERRDSEGLFAAIREAMSALRSELPETEDEHERKREAIREAWMRDAVRRAREDGARRVAVVCGAWHAPVLDPETADAKEDERLLKGLPKVKAQVTWIPWTYDRLSMTSGYRAGVASPGWYEHLWLHEGRVAERWLTRVARLLRGEDLDASSAQTIEAVRLTEALAALRGRPLPGLPEMNEACQAIFCFGSELPLQLIARRLIVGETLGRVPEATPAVPIQQDLQREQKRLRMAPLALQEELALDLRKPLDLDRSRLLHRLLLLEVPWGRTIRAAGRGTFKEVWSLTWKPEFAIALIDAARWGHTVGDAAGAFAVGAAQRAQALPELTVLIGRVMLCDLPAAAAAVMARLHAVSAVASDVTHLMDALPPLAEVLRYGNVRQTDADMAVSVVDGLVARICVGVPLACGSLNDEAAEAMFGRIQSTNAAIQLLQNTAYTEPWNAALKKLTDLPAVHGLITGHAVRLLLEAGMLGGPEASQRISLALSGGSDPAAGAAWIEGFLRGSGQLLIHDESLWNLVDGWVSALNGDAFTSVLPLLRRTFGTFTPPERRAMGERVKRAETQRVPAAHSVAADSAAFDAARAEAVLPLLARLLGVAGGRQT